MRRRKILITVLIAVVAGSLSLLWMGSKKPDTVHAAAGELTNIDGKPFTFADFRGKVVFVNNWASWCPPCIAEMPGINELKQKLKGEDIAFVMVSFDEDKEKAMAFMKRKGFDFDVYFPGLNYPFHTSSIPATYILDKSGNVVSEHFGMADYSSNEFVTQLKKLASGDSAGK